MRYIKYLFIQLSLAGVLSTAFAQVSFPSNRETYKVVYAMSSNGKQMPGQNKTVVIANQQQTLVTSERGLTNNSQYPFEFFTVDRKSNVQVLYALLSDDQSISTVDSNAILSQKFELLNDTKTILGYTCKKAKTVVNSNTIELWYTNDLHIKGAPTVLGQDLGLVLEMIRNGNATTTAIEIGKEVPALPAYYTAVRSIKMDLITYRDEIWKSRFTTIPVFTSQLIHFSDTATVPEGVMRFANGTIVVKKVRFPKFGSAKNIFVDIKEQSNGDAYDRTGTVFLIPPGKEQSFLDGLKNGINTLPLYENGNGKKYRGVAATSSYNPAIELVRFFTPFGVKQYNYIQLKGKQWQDAVYYRQDITSFSSLLDGREVYIGVFIGNYDKGGHRIDANITIHNAGAQAPAGQKVVPLFNTLNIMEMAGQEYGTMFDNDKGLLMEFELKEPVKNAALRYITTGHGGWGRGDEFVPKENTVLLDGQVVFKMVPWREDCGSYRLYNPASGNFNDGLSSSDLSRSNWCPGTVTNPYMISLGNLAPGRHTIQVKIPQGKPEGTSFSAWNVSGVLIGD